MLVAGACYGDGDLVAVGWSDVDAFGTWSGVMVSRVADDAGLIAMASLADEVRSLAWPGTSMDVDLLIHIENSKRLPPPPPFRRQI